MRLRLIILLSSAAMLATVPVLDAEAQQRNQGGVRPPVMSPQSGAGLSRPPIVRPPSLPPGMPPQGRPPQGMPRPPQGDGGWDRPRPPGFPRGWGDPVVIIDPRGVLPPPPRGVAPVFEEDPPPRRRVRQVREARPPAAPPPRRTSPAPGAPRGVIVPPAGEERYVTNEVLLTVRDGAARPNSAEARADEERFARLLRGQRLSRMESRRIELIGATWHRVRIEDGRDPRVVLRALQNQARIVAAQPNYVYRLEQLAPAEIMPETAAPPADPTRAQAAPEKVSLPASAPAPRQPEALPQYVTTKLGLPGLHAMTKGWGVRIGLVDSGVDANHAEIAGTVDKAFDALTGTAPNADDADGHGTGMASAVLARGQLLGVAPEARLLAARAFKGATGGDRTGQQGTSWHVLQGIDWSVSEGARVLNLSFAGPRDALVAQALAAAVRRGVIPVAAAGNAGPSSQPLFPGSDPNVIAVTAIDEGDRLFAMSNRGRHITLAAPGVDVLVAQPRGGYGLTTGTSVATAHVSGIVALMLARDPRLDLARARAILAASARDAGAPGPDVEFGAGIIDGPAALARLQASAALRN